VGKEQKIGLLQALGVTLYCSLVGFLMWNGETIFGQMKSILGPITFLLMFLVSAMICGLLVFYYPYKLFTEGKKQAAASVILVTTVSLLVILIIFIAFLLIIRQ